MAITPLPTPPSRDDPANFATRADAFMSALPDFATEANALAVAVNADAVSADADAATATTKASEASTSASNALTSANNASASQIAAAASAASAAAIAGAFVGTSTTSLTIGLGTKSFTTQTGEQYTAGIWITAVSAANGSNYMFGQVTSYSGSTLVVDMQASSGSGTFADWNLSLAGVRGPAGAGVTPQSNGFTVAAGTSTLRTLTVDADATASQLVTLSGTQSVSNKTVSRSILSGSVEEKITISATAATGTINYDVITQQFLYYTTNASGNFTLNIRGDGSTSLNTLMAVGDSITLVFMNTNGTTAYYQSALTIDGTSVTPKWQGGTAPVGGNASSIDVYAMTIVKTASATFTVFESVSKFA